MATAAVLEFMQKTAENEALRQQLEALLGVGDGNISSEAELDAEESQALGERAPLVADFAAKNGYDFSTAELLTVVDAFKKHQAGEMSDEDFADLIGAAIVDEEGEMNPKVANPLKRLGRYLTKTYLGY